MVFDLKKAQESSRKRLAQLESTNLELREKLNIKYRELNQSPPDEQNLASSTKYWF